MSLCGATIQMIQLRALTLKAYMQIRAMLARLTDNQEVAG